MTDSLSSLLFGIRIVDASGHYLTDRLSLSSGTRRAQSYLYETAARIPQSPWRSLDAFEIELLTADTADFDPGSSVAVVAAPSDLVKSIRGSLSVASNEISFSAALSSLAPAVIEFAESWRVDPAGDIRLIGATTNRVDLPTTTFDPRTSLHIGLHLDSFYRHELDSRHRAPNRLCLNAGAEDRFLLFINLALRRMHTILMREKISDPRVIGQRVDVGDVFMEVFPAYPVVKLRIRPGEAYIAPTENMIHDGATEGKRCLDVAITLVGPFGIPRPGAINMSGAASKTSKGISRSWNEAIG